MKQNLYTLHQPYMGEVEISSAINAWFRWAALVLHTWNQRNALAKLSSRLLADTGISEAQRLAETNKPFWRA